MTPHEAWNIDVDHVVNLPDDVILLRLEHAIQLAKRNKQDLKTSTANVTYPEALKRPACVAKLVEWKLQGLI